MVYWQYPPALFSTQDFSMLYNHWMFLLCSDNDDKERIKPSD
jgi:hypothetical protein